MIDNRQKDKLWNVLSDDGKYLRSMEGGAAHIAVLMDIRDELKKLNCLLSCSNFTGIPHTLKRIQTNTAKPRKSRKT